MADASDLTIKGQGQVRVPEAVRRRWGLQDGDLVTYVDLGDAMMILPGGTDVLRRSLLDSTFDGDEDRTGGSIDSSEPRGRPPDSGDSFRLASGPAFRHGGGDPVPPRLGQVPADHDDRDDVAYLEPVCFGQEPPYEQRNWLTTVTLSAPFLFDGGPDGLAVRTARSTRLVAGSSPSR